MKKSLLLCALIVVLFLGIGVPLKAHGEDALHLVMVPPFQVHSDEPLDYIQRSLPRMLASRLDAEPSIETVDESVVFETLAKLGVEKLDEDAAREMGRMAGVDWVVLGTVTKIGQSVSLDAKVLDIATSRPTVSVYAQEKTTRSLIDGIGVLAKRVSLRISGKTLVTDISIGGNRLIEDAAILYQIDTKVGDVFSMEKIQDDIRNIYDMGYFNDIKVDSADEPFGKRITFIVKENPEIAEIRIAGNKEVDTTEIQDELDIKMHTILDYNKAKDNASKIKAFYKGKGYYNALVDYHVQDVGRDKVALTFQVVEHHPMKIKEITITGNESLKAKKIKKILETREKNLLSFITNSGTFKEEALEHDLERIKAFYYDHGFLDIKVGEPEVTNDEKWIYIAISVEEGDQYQIESVTVAGDLVQPEEELMKYVKVTPDELFSRKKIHDDIMALTDVYGEYGFAFTDISPLTKMNAENKTVGLTYDIAQGEKVYFEKITVSGNIKTRDKVVRREMRVREEDLYNNKKLNKSRERLNNLGFFEEVKINTTKGSAPDRMNLDISVKEKPTGMISAGAGYSSVDNVVGMFQVSQNNFMGKGVQLTLMAQVGGNSRYRLGITEPYLFDKEISAGFDVFALDIEYDDFDSKNQGIELSIGFLPYGLEDYTLGFKYNFSDVDISGVWECEALELQEAEAESPTMTSSLTAILTRDTINDRFYPMYGSQASLSFETAGLGGEKFMKTVVDARKYFPLKWGTAFMMRGSAGWAWGYGGDGVPVFERFFLGGLDSLRGFEYRSVGPEGTRPPDSQCQSDDPEDEVIGGDKMMLFNFEFLFPIIKEAKIRGLFFFDMGNAWEKGDSFDFDLRKSVGWGVRWNSPFGPLRVEWGLNLDPEDDEDNSQFEFSVGSGF